MILTCSSFRASSMPDGRIQVQLSEAAYEPAEDRLYIKDIARELKLSPRTVYALSTRKRNPLPLVRGRGRPFGLRSRINAWMIPVTVLGNTTARTAKVFGN